MPPCPSSSSSSEKIEEDRRNFFPSGSRIWRLSIGFLEEVEGEGIGSAVSILGVWSEEFILSGERIGGVG
jgi:hypothetical protein